MIYVFEKINVDENEVYTVRETTGKVLFSSSSPLKLVDFFKNLGL